MRARIGLEDDHTSHSRSRPTAADRLPRAPQQAREFFRARGYPESSGYPAGESAGPNTRTTTARGRGQRIGTLPHPPLSVSPFREAARILETDADALLEANMGSSPTSATAAARSRSSIMASVDLRKQTLGSS